MNQQFTSPAKQGEQIGSGSFAKVYKGELTLKTNLNNNSELQQTIPIAIKRISLINRKSKLLSQKYIEREIEILSQCQHPNIIKFYGFFQEENYIDIYLELCDGSLDELISFPVTESILKAVTYLKEKQIENKQNETVQGLFHRDINLKNVLIKNGKLKLSDFGLARLNLLPDEEATFRMGTPLFMSPQNQFKRDYNLEKNDVWSLGVLLYLFVFGKKSYNIEKAYSKNLLFPNHITISDSFQSLIRKMLEVDEQERYDFSNIQIHPLIQNQNSSQIVYTLQQKKFTYEQRIEISNNLFKLIQQLDDICLQDKLITIILAIQGVWLYKQTMKWRYLSDEIFQMIMNQYVEILKRQIKVSMYLIRSEFIGYQKLLKFKLRQAKDEYIKEILCEIDLSLFHLKNWKEKKIQILKNSQIYQM